MHIKNIRFYLRLVLSVLLLISPCPSLRATTKTNYAEMISALTTMVVDMAANHYAFKKDLSTAAKLKTATDILSLSTKGLFFYNNIEAKNGTGVWSFDDRDCQANAVLTLRDTTKLAQHLYDVYSLLPKDVSTELSDITITPEILEAALKEQVVADSQEQAFNSSSTSTLEYARKVVILPALKGLTAFALACTQNYATTYSGNQARFTATAAHCFANLLEEYSNLAPNSRMSKPLLIALVVNALWLAVETSSYIDQQAQLPGIMRQHAEQCAVCNRASNHKQLHCGHFRCMHCLRDAVRQQNDNNQADLDQIVCINPGCHRHLNRNDICHIVGNDPDIMQGYDRARFNHQQAPVPGPRPIPAPERVEPLRMIAGVCILCGEEGQVARLGCGHAELCRNCSRIRIQVAFNHNVANLDHTECTHAGCRHHLRRDEIATLVGRRAIAAQDGEAECSPQEILAAFDRAVEQRREANAPDAAELAAIARHEIQICPRCGQRAFVEVPGPCNYTHCECGQDFCFHCGIALGRENHGNHYPGFGDENGRCPLWYRPGQPRVDNPPRGD